MIRILLDEFPESLIGDPLIIVRRKEENLATINMDEKRVDCQDEYMRMRLYGIMDQHIGSFNELE
jgi:hypothetical protein